MFVEAGVPTIWLPPISEANAFDLAMRTAWRAGRRRCVNRKPRLQAINPLEDVMDASFVPTFVACGAIFALSFFMIWVFWFLERLRGAGAPHL
jgi:hypothetical protein